MIEPSDSQLTHKLQANLDGVRQRIALAAERSGRTADSVTLVAVTKYTPIEVVQTFHKISLSPLGENRPQQLIERSQILPNSTDWHLIGQLQRNKVKAVLPHTKLIHSIDSIRLLKAVDRHARELDVQPHILLQVNTSGEESKSGFTPDELRSNWPEISQFKHVEIRGLMTMAPDTPDKATIRNTFSELRRLKDEINETDPTISLSELSMGMSQDFEIAIEEGATLIRLGSTLFADCNDN